MFQLGMAVGHIYYFLEDVFPNQPGGMKLIRTPRVLRILCDGENDEDRAYEPLPEGDRPGGYAWGGQANGDQAAAADQANDNNNEERRWSLGQT